MEQQLDVRARRFKPHPEYRHSGVEWLGEIPAAWQVRPLKRALLQGSADGSLIKGRMHSEPGEGLYPGFSASGQDIWVDEAQHHRAGIVLSAVGARCGKTFKADGSWTAVANTHVLFPEQGYDRDFLWYLSNDESFWERGGTAQPFVRVSSTLQRSWCFPSIDEQRAIVAFLDRETTRVDALVSKMNRLIALLEEKRTGLITRAVSKGLDPNVPMKDSGVEWLGEIPAHWNIAPLRGFAKTGYKTFTDGDWIESPYIRAEGIRLIQTGNIGTGFYKEQGFRYIDEETFKTFRCTEILPGDVLICRLADPVGRACLAPELGVRMITSVDVCILKVARDVDPQFIVYALSSSRYLSWMSSICRGGTRDRISRSMLGSIRIQKAPLVDQRTIVAFLDRGTAEIDALVAKVRKSIDHLEEFRAALISAAVTGKIDVREERA